jgi:hypothetical protein
MNSHETFEIIKRLNNAFLGFVLLQIEIALGDKSQAQRLESIKKSLKDKNGDLLRELKRELVR